MEEMTSSEGVLAVIRGETPDRAPVSSLVAGYAARVCGIRLREYYPDMEKCIQAQLLTKDLHGYDDAPSYGWAEWGAGVFGGSLGFPESYVRRRPNPC